MAIAEAYSGSATISTTEYSLTANSTVLGSITTDGVYQPILDLNALTVTETYEFRIYEKARAADTQRVAYKALFTGPLATPIVVMPSVILLHGWEMTMDKIAGTDRVITWSIRQVA